MPGFAVTTPGTQKSHTINTKEVIWDPSVDELFSNDFNYFYGIQYNPLTGRLTIQEIDDEETVIQIPDYRVGDSTLTTEDPYYDQSETLDSAQSNLDKWQILDPASPTVYKNWMITYSQADFYWYTSGGGSYNGHFVMEVF
jgi:hypothetical protein